MTSGRKQRKEERKTKVARSRQSQVAYNRDIYDELCGLIRALYHKNDSGVRDLPEPIPEGTFNSYLSVTYTRAMIGEAVDALRVGVKAALLDKEASAREYSDLVRRASEGREGDYDASD